MSIQEYISTGILEAYALGELSEPEQDVVAKNLEQYPELREELEKIELTVQSLLLKTAVKPRVEVKVQLFEKLNGRQASKVVPLVSFSSETWKLAAAASIAIALVSSFLAYNYWSKWNASESRLADLIVQNQQMARNYNTVNQGLDKIKADLAVTTNPDFSWIVMSGTTNAPQSLASVYWNSNTKEVYLSIQNLKELSEENQYQLWAIIDGEPVDCGVFDLNKLGLLKMKEAFASPTTFAVTIEPRGGRPSPTLETMQVAGNVIKG